VFVILQQIAYEQFRLIKDNYFPQEGRKCEISARASSFREANV